MASAPPPPQPQHQSAPPAPRYNANSNIQSSSGGRSDGRGNYGGRGRGGGDGGGRGGYGRGAGGGRGGGNNYGNHPGGGRGAGRGGGNYNNNNSGPSTQQPRPANAVPYGYLPPYLPGASSLVEQLDRKLLVILRDGRHLVGTLLSFDQFSNMVMQETSERRILVVAKEKSEKNDDASDGNENDVQPSTPKSICYQTDIELGLFVVRGDNVVLLGEVDDEEEMNDGQIRFVSLEEFEQLEEEETKRKEESGEGDEAINWDFDMDLVA